MLPQWLSGYAFLFQTAPDVARAKQLISQLRLPAVNLSYPANDGFARSVAERVALNARDAGIMLQPTGNSGRQPDAVFVGRSNRSTPRRNSTGMRGLLGDWRARRSIDSPARPETLYEAERAMLDAHRVIPLVYLPEVYGIAPRVHQLGNARRSASRSAASGKRLGGPMSFRTKVFLSITATVVIAVWIVAGVVSTLVTQFVRASRRAAHRGTGLPVPREFDRRGARSCAPLRCHREFGRGAAHRGESRRVQSRHRAILRPGANAGREQSLDFLELVGPDGSIISSAEWPARFGYKESWLLAAGDWKTQGVFLKREELADGPALGLITVRTVKAGNGLLYIAGGQRLDKEFLDSLPAAEGMRIQLYRNFDAAAVAGRAWDRSWRPT